MCEINDYIIITSSIKPYDYDLKLTCNMSGNIKKYNCSKNEIIKQNISDTTKLLKGGTFLIYTKNIDCNKLYEHLKILLSNNKPLNGSSKILKIIEDNNLINICKFENEEFKVIDVENDDKNILKLFTNMSLIKIEENNKQWNFKNHFDFVKNELIKYINNETSIFKNIIYIEINNDFLDFNTTIEDKNDLKNIVENM